MSTNRINLYSDTQTLPTAAMREVMARAEVGDEQRGEDPSVNALCARVAELLDKEAAVFMPSGTMCNEIAIAVHCRPGDEVIADRSAHILNFEGGGPGALAGVQIHGIDGVHGIFTAEQAEAAVRARHRYAPRSRLVEIENTANWGGGTIWPLAGIEAVSEVAKRHSLALHLDGARLPNAVVASGVSFSAYAATFDSLWIDLSKGLGCPVGAVLAGSHTFIEEAWYWKQRMGGAMRQAGILAAAGSHALEHHLDRLAEDHDNARRFAEGIKDIEGVAVDLETVQTNIVYFDVAATGKTAAELSARLEEQGVVIGALGPSRLRAVTHLDVAAASIPVAVAAVRDACAG